MRPGYVSILFLIIAAILLVFSLPRRGSDEDPTPIAQRVRRRTGLIFILVAVGLFVFDQMSR